MAAPELVDDSRIVSGAVHTVDLSPRMLEKAENLTDENVWIISPQSQAMGSGRHGLRGVHSPYQPMATSAARNPSVANFASPNHLAVQYFLGAHQAPVHPAPAHGMHQYLATFRTIGQIEGERIPEPFNLGTFHHTGRTPFDPQDLPLPDLGGIFTVGGDPLILGQADVSDAPPPLGYTQVGQIHFGVWNAVGVHPETHLPPEWDNLRETSQVVGTRITAMVLAPESVEKPTSLATLIEPDTDVVLALRNSRYREVSERLDYLNAELADDPDWDIDEVDPDSVASFATFLLSEDLAALPIVGLHPSGFIFAQWRVIRQQHDEFWGVGDGSLVMVFEPSQLVNYAAICGKADDGASAITANGVLPVQNLRSSLGYFLSRVAEFEFNED